MMHPRQGQNEHNDRDTLHHLLQTGNTIALGTPFEHDH